MAAAGSFKDDDTLVLALNTCVVTFGFPVGTTVIGGVLGLELSLGTSVPTVTIFGLSLAITVAAVTTLGCPLTAGVVVIATFGLALTFGEVEITLELILDAAVEGVTCLGFPLDEATISTGLPLKATEEDSVNTGLPREAVGVSTNFGLFLFVFATPDISLLLLWDLFPLIFPWPSSFLAFI